MTFIKGDIVVGKEESSNLYNITSWKNNYVGEVISIDERSRIKLKTLSGDKGLIGGVHSVYKYHFELQNAKKDTYEIY